MNVPDQPSKVERAKKKSRRLRGTIREVLDSDADRFRHDDVQALKFHGVYQQDNRDSRVDRRKAGLDKEFMYMVRAKLPGGVLTADQYLGLDEIADKYSWNRSLRITTRQGFQLHGIVKNHLRDTIREMNEALISTLAACGDVERNVMASAVPYADAPHRRARELAAEIARELCPATGAYHEIWLDGEKVESSRETEEPFYGDRYLPRKFKTAVALPDDNSVDVHSQDVGLVAVVDDGELVGADVLVGGGFGMTHKKEDTFARLGTPLGFVPADRIVDAVRTIAAIFRDHGDRSDRRHARLKYLIEDWGMVRFRETFEETAGFEVGPWREVGPMRFADPLGSHPQGDGRLFYGLFVESGRIRDSEIGGPRLKTALREIVERLRPGVVLAPHQNLFLTDLAEDDVEEVEAILKIYDALPAELSAARRYSMACPALPTCGLALSDAERALPGLIDVLEEKLAALGLDDEPFTIRMTGCPNGCARPYSADLGFVGRGPGLYDVFVGGRLAGDRLADLYAARVREAEIPDLLSPLFEAWGRERYPEEGLGDFYQRAFRDGEHHRTILTGSKEGAMREVVEERLAVLA